jgi:hypothetical protein
MRVGELLSPVVGAMRRDLLTTSYIQADETPVPVQMHDRRGENHQAYLWQYGKPGGETVFDFCLGRGCEGPRKFLGKWEGILQTEGYAAYDDIGAQTGARGLLGARAAQVRRRGESESAGCRSGGDGHAHGCVVFDRSRCTAPRVERRRASSATRRTRPKIRKIDQPELRDFFERRLFEPLFEPNPFLQPNNRALQAEPFSEAFLQPNNRAVQADRFFSHRFFSTDRFFDPIFPERLALGRY